MCRLFALHSDRPAAVDGQDDALEQASESLAVRARSEDLGLSAAASQARAAQARAHEDRRRHLLAMAATVGADTARPAHPAGADSARPDESAENAA